MGIPFSRVEDPIIYRPQEVIMRMTPLGTVLGLALVGVLTVACEAEPPTTIDAPSVHAMATMTGFAAAAAHSPEARKALADLRQASAKWHNLDSVHADGYAFLACIDERIAGVAEADARGMGFHYARSDEGTEATIDFLNPELVIFARRGGSDEMHLAGFDYFVPGNAWDVAEEGGPPNLFGIDFTWSVAFDGWMFHAWPWWNNPDGMFDNFNPTIPLCECEDPNVPDGLCFDPPA